MSRYDYWLFHHPTKKVCHAQAKSQGSQCLLVFTNQLRDKINVRFGSPTTTPGGRALKFYANLRLEMYRTTALKDGENTYGQLTHVNVVKNKVGPPFRRAQFDLVYGLGIDYYAELLDLSVTLGIVQQAGAWFSLNGQQLGQGRKAAVDFLRNDKSLCYRLWDEVLTRAMLERGFNADGTAIPGMTEPPSQVLTLAFTPTPEQVEDNSAELEEVTA